MSAVSRLLLGLSFVALGASVRAQQSEALDEASASELRALLTRAKQVDAPGGILAVLRRGEACFVEPFGLADVEKREPITRTTVFYLASVAKEFTAACVLHAAAAGKLALDEPITKRVPGLPASYGAVRITNLLEHRGGVPDVYDLAIGLDLGRETLSSNQGALALLRKLPQLDFTPGTRFRYSNSGYVLLAEALGAGRAQRGACACRPQPLLRAVEPPPVPRAPVPPEGRNSCLSGQPGARSTCSRRGTPCSQRSSWRSRRQSPHLRRP